MTTAQRDKIAEALAEIGKSLQMQGIDCLIFARLSKTEDPDVVSISSFTGKGLVYLLEASDSFRKDIIAKSVLQDRGN